MNKNVKISTGFWDTCVFFPLEIMNEGKLLQYIGK